jgi:hypothetical protein
MELHPDMNAQDLLGLPEVQAKLAEAIKGLAADSQLQAAINKSVDLAACFKGLEGPPGSFKLDLDVKNYDDLRKQRMLAAVLSGRPKAVVQFLVDELSEAAAEFTFTGSDRTSNGVSVEPKPKPPVSPPPSRPD